MEYVVIKDSETYKKLVDLKSRIDDAYNKAKALSIELGGDGDFLKCIHNISGGLRGFKLDKNKALPLNAKFYVHSDEFLYYRISSNKKFEKNLKHIWAKIEALPKVTFHDVNAIFGTEHKFGFTIIYCPSVCWHKTSGVITVDMFSLKHSKNPDLKPIS